MAPKTQAASKTQAKPVSKAGPAPKAEIQEMTVNQRPALPAHEPSGRSAQSALLGLMGLATTLIGLALALGPKLSWKVDKIMVGFDYLGVHGGTLVMGGLVLLGIAMVLRQVNHVSAIAAQSGEDTSLLESVAADVLQVGSALESVQASVEDLAGELGNLRSAIAAVGEQAAARPASDTLGSEDAIFRLAASLDKVGAKIEERLKSQFGDLTEHLGKLEIKLEASVTETVRRLERPPAMPAPQAPRPGAPYPAPALHQTAHYAQPHPGGYPSAPQIQAPIPHPAHFPHPAHPGPVHPAHPGLHQTAHRPAPGLQLAPAAPPPPQPVQQFPVENPNSLGLLDQLDDNGVASPLPSAAPLHFNAPPPLSMADAPAQLDPWADQQPVNPVMSDPEVRAALEDMGRQGRGR